MQWFEFADGGQQVTALVQTVSARLSDAIATQGRAVLAVSGGRSPIPFFQSLSQQPLDWSRITITLVDERFVPSAHADSNARLVREHLLQNQALAARFIPLVEKADDLDAELAVANQDFLSPTVAILGMGDDGHTASLFPDAAELADGLNPARTLPLLAVTPPVAPHRRISMSYAALVGSGSLILSIQGAGKRHVFEQAMQGRNDHLPVSYFLHQTETNIDVYWAS